LNTPIIAFEDINDVLDYVRKEIDDEGTDSQ